MTATQTTALIQTDFSIHEAMQELHDVMALATAAKAIVSDVGIHEVGDYGWRVLDMLETRLLATIHKLDQLDTKLNSEVNA